MRVIGSHASVVRASVETMGLVLPPFLPVVMLGNL